MEEKKVKQEEQSAEESAFLEALLEFQIEKKEAAIDKVLFDLKQVEKKNKEYNERNDNLKEEREAHIRRILRRIEEKEQEKDAKEVVTRDDVEESLKDKWQYAKDKEQILKDLLFQTEETDQRLSVRQSERDYWLEYKNVGSRTDANKIKNLKKDIKEVKDDFQRSSEYYRNALKAMKEENDTLVEMNMKKNKEQAPENAVRYLDKNSCREIEENEWLKEEVKLYRKEVRDLKASVQLLEEENISIVRKLMDNKIQNLRVPRHLFLTQAAGLQDESLQDESKAVEHREYSAKTDGEESLRRATVSCQKKKSFPKIQCETEIEKSWDRDEELQEMSLTPILNSLFEVERDFQEYLKLGPLVSNPMCVVGRAMPIHKEPEETPSKSPAEGNYIGESDRHITPQMIKALSKEKTRCTDFPTGQIALQFLTSSRASVQPFFILSFTPSRSLLEPKVLGTDYQLLRNLALKEA